MKKRMVMASLLCALVFMCGCSSNRILSPLSTSNTTKYTANYNITMQFTQNPDAKEAPLYTVQMGMAMDFEQVGSDTNAISFQSKINSLNIKTEGLGERLEYDSTQPTHTPMLFDSLVGAVLTFDTDKGGRILSINGFDQVEKKKRTGGENTEIAQVLYSILLGPDSFKNYFSNLTGIYPEDTTIEKGETWEKSFMPTSPIPLTINTAYTYSVISTDDNIVVTSESTVIAPSEHKINTPWLNGTLRELNATYAGKYLIAENGGFAQSGTTDQTISASFVTGNESEGETATPVRLSMKTAFVVNKTGVSPTSTPTK